MKNIAGWNFNAPLEDVNVVRILDEAQDATGKATAVKVTVKRDGVRYYAVCVGRDTAIVRGLGQPHVYLGQDSGFVTEGGDVAFGGIPGEIPLVVAPGASVAVYLFTSNNSANAFVRKALDLVEVKVEIF